MPQMSVDLFFRTMSITVCASSGFGWQVARTWVRSGYHRQPTRPKEWKNGSTAHMWSAVEVASSIRSASTSERTLWWLSITPFGSPVEPDEKSTIAVESGPVRSVRTIQRIGRNFARSSAPSLAGSETSFMRSSRKT